MNKNQQRQREIAIAKGLDPDVDFGGEGVSLHYRRSFDNLSRCLCGSARFWAQYYTPVDCNILCAVCDPPPEEFACDVFEDPGRGPTWDEEIARQERFERGEIGFEE